MAKPVVVYLSNAIDESIKTARHITTDSPAATNKVLGLAGAMRQAGVRCIVLSLGRGHQTGSGDQHRPVARRFNHVAMLYCAFWQLPILTHVVTMISLAFWMGRLIRRHPGLTVLAYNRSWHYVPALMFARLLRTRTFLDLEDGYTVDGRGRLRQLKNTLTRTVFNWLCPDGALLANASLVAQLAHPSPLVCYGVVESEGRPQQDWRMSKLQILFSGTLLEEVGSHLLLVALNILREHQPSLVQQLRFVVTGKGPCAEAFRSFSAEAPEWLCFREALPREAYRDTLRSSHIGLSLRLTAFEMGETTFPSKVVEFAQHGLLVLTTRASDVPILFGDAALYLDEETPEALAFLLASLPERRTGLKAMAVQGREKVIRSCNPETVGQALKFLLTK